MVTRTTREAIRDLTRAGLAELDERSPERAAFMIVDIHKRGDSQPPKRLTRAFHDHHDLSLATMHVHLDHESCLEVAVLRGAMNDLRHFAAHIISERVG